MESFNNNFFKKQRKTSKKRLTKFLGLNVIKIIIGFFGVIVKRLVRIVSIVWSPNIAAIALRFLAGKMKPSYPRGGSILEEETYVDDVITSDESPINANKSKREIDRILAEGNFKIKTWNSNHTSIDQNGAGKEVGVSGHQWDKINDTISLKYVSIDLVDGIKLTKRTILDCGETMGPIWISSPSFY